MIKQHYNMNTAMQKQLKGKKAEGFTMVGLDGNAFALMGAFRKHATRDPDWVEAEVQAVCNEAMSGDYNHLLAVLATYSND